MDSIGKTLHFFSPRKTPRSWWSDKHFSVTADAEAKKRFYETQTDISVKVNLYIALSDRGSSTPIFFSE